MIETVENFLKEYGLNQPDNTLLVGFSGGCDSLCLLDILQNLSKKYKFNVIALHLNHNWRGEESLQEENNCKKYCERMDVKCIIETLEETNQKTEAVAREARYNFFLKQARKYSNSCILTAHTRTDNAETLIYRIIKGTGIKGIQGILPKRYIEEIPIYRPLLNISRKQIQDYCNSKGLVPNTDSSNFDITYKRNFIRHKIMPLFDEINFHSEKSIVSLANIAISHSNIVDEYMNLIKKDIYSGNKILTSKFRNLSDDIMRKLIYDVGIREHYDYDSKKISNILEFLKNNFDSKSGSRCSITNDLWLFANSQYIYLITKTKADENLNETSITNEGEYDVLGTNYVFSIKKYKDNKDLKFPAETEDKALVDLNEVGLNLTVRTRRDGDFITPFGMNGTMKLKKYLNSKHISQHKKDGLILLTKGQEVLWVIGGGLSNKLKVVNSPTHVLELRKKN